MSVQHSSEVRSSHLRGVLAPVVTPFTSGLRPDLPRLVEHCRWLLSQNCGLAVFGTNSEGNSLSVDEKIEIFDGLLSANVDPARMMPGSGCCALPDTVRLTRHFAAGGCSGVLVLPPFYYKGVSEDGLYFSYSEVIQRVGESSLRIYLYHIPHVSGIGISIGLIERLVDEYPGVVIGIKDSGGDWHHTQALIDRFRGVDFDVFVGSESFLLANMQHGGVGCISATANVNPAAIDRVYRLWREPNAADLQAELDKVRGLVGMHGMIPSLKATIAHFTGHAEWSLVRPPLDQLSVEQAADLINELNAVGFTMPGVVSPVSADSSVSAAD